MMEETGIQHIEKKIISQDKASEIGREFREHSKTLVFTNGCFDLLHPGHVDLLIRSRMSGDALMVGLNTDAGIKRLKGPSRPVLDERARSLMIAALEVVDWVVLFDTDTPYELIEAVKPMVLIKGGDYTPDKVVGKDIVESHGGRVEIVKFNIEVSTSEIISKLGRTE